SFLNRSVQQVGDRTTFVLHRQSLAVVSRASTYIAQDVDVREKIHLDALQPVALTRLATPALHVERESSRFVASFARLGGHRIQLPDRSEHSGVRSWIRSRSSSDRRLIDLYDLVDVFETQYLTMRSRLDKTSIDLP